MAGRPPLPPGTWGKISVSKTQTGTYQAEARYAFFSGNVAKQRARGHSDSSARSALIQKLKELNDEAGIGNEITRTSTVAELAEFWLLEKELEGLAANTLRGYRTVANNHILPAIGARRIGTCRTGVVDQVIKNHGAAGRSTAKLRNALHQMFDVAVRHDALPANPVASAKKIRRPKRKVLHLDVDQVADVRELIDTAMKKKRPGPRMSDDLRDMVDLILATGCRIGEVLGFIYPEIDLSSEMPTVTVSGTVVTETGKGTFRQPWPKTNAGFRTLVLPPFGVDIVLRRTVEKSANPLDAVFATRNKTWYQVANLETMWNRIVDDTAYDWVTFHVFRKSVATLIDRSVDAKAAAAQLGHTNEQITIEHYIHKPKLAPDLTAHLEAFRRT
jgi:integrase